MIGIQRHRPVCPTCGAAMETTDWALVKEDGKVLATGSHDEIDEMYREMMADASD